MKKKWIKVLAGISSAVLLVTMPGMSTLAGALEEELIESEAEDPNNREDLEESLDVEFEGVYEGIDEQDYENEEVVGASVGDKVTATLNNGVVVFYSADGTLSRQWINRAGFDKNDIKSIRVESGTVHLPADSSWMFAGCSNLENLNLKHFETSTVTRMDSMFSGCSSLKILDLGTFNTSNVTDMDGLFCGCSALPFLDVSMFDTSNVKDMSNMFGGCSGLKELDVKNFDTSNVTHMVGMFASCSGLEELDLCNFNTAQVKSMITMFEGCTDLKKLFIDNDKFDVTNVSEMNYMFKDCSSLTELDLNNFAPSALIGVKGMFENCSSLINLHLSNIDMSKIVDNNYDDAFKGCSALCNIWTPKNIKKSIKLPAVFNDELKKEYHYLPYNSESMLITRDYFSLVRGDHNQYLNEMTDFYTNDEQKEKKAKYFTSYATKLLQDLDYKDKAERNRIIEYLNMDFDGACLGANLSMVLKNIGVMQEFTDSYFRLGYPLNNTQLRDIINYYQVLYARNDFSADYMTMRGIGGLRNNLPQATQLDVSQFLEKFVSEASKSQSKRKPFIFNYSYKKSLSKSGGHSVIVCGFDDKGNYRDNKLEYRIKIYDLNYDRRHEEYKAKYIYMYVDSEYNSFHFQDIEQEKDKKNQFLEDTWTSMYYIGIDNLDTSDYYKIGGSSTSAGSSSIRNEETEYSTIIIDADKSFILSNAQGKTMSYNGNYSGDLEIYSLEMICKETPSLRIQVLPSDYFKITGMEGDFSISVENSGHYYRTSTSEADEILLSKDEGIVFDGDGPYSFEAVLDADIKGYSLVEISSSASGKVNITNPDDSITLDSDMPCKDIVVTYMDINGSTEDVIPEETDHFNIFEDDGKIKYGDGINIAKATILGVESNYQYNGNAIRPDITVMLEGNMLKKDMDYSVEYLNNVNVGTATVKIRGIGAYEGNKIAKFTIVKKAEKGFSDVQDPSHPYYKAIYWAADAGITKGYDDGTFGINRSCTRGEMMMFLWRYAGKQAPKNVSKSPFKDVPKTHAFYKAILWGSQKGITKGYSDGTFGINRNVSRGECMMFLWRLKGKPAPKAVAKAPFPDVPKSHVFYNAVLWGYQKKITTGFTSGKLKGKFGVNENCSRGQIVTFLYRAK